MRPYHNKVCFWIMKCSQFTWTTHPVHSVIVFVLRITFGTLTRVKHLSLPYSQEVTGLMIIMMIINMTCTVHGNDSNRK